jgi:hypothetical protein
VHEDIGGKCDGRGVNIEYAGSVTCEGPACCDRLPKSVANGPLANGGRRPGDGGVGGATDVLSVVTGGGRDGNNAGTSRQ